MVHHYQVKAIYTGKVQQVYGFNTAINKSLATQPMYLDFLGLDDDECADLKHHSGKERALHHYPSEHYAYWQERYGKQLDWAAPGMGENISSVGMTENTVCIGDRYQWGKAIIEVSQPRSPCFKLNKRWGLADISTHMQSVSRCGWLYRVLQCGEVSVEEPLVLIQQVTNPMTIKTVCDIFLGEPLNKNGLIRLSQQEKLSTSWRETVHKRLETNQVERWDFRLLGFDNTKSNVCK